MVAPPATCRHDPRHIRVPPAAARCIAIASARQQSPNRSTIAFAASKSTASPCFKSTGPTRALPCAKLSTRSPDSTVRANSNTSASPTSRFTSSSKPSKLPVSNRSSSLTIYCPASPKLKFSPGVLSIRSTSSPTPPSPAALSPPNTPPPPQLTFTIPVRTAPTLPINP